MRQLILALYAEGRTDERFLPIIIQRAADGILRRQALAPVDVLEPLSLKSEVTTNNNAECILSVAKQARGFHALIVHADADSSTSDRALSQRFQPGQQLVEESEEDVCHDLVPIIPIRMTESWMMADIEAFRRVVGTNFNAEDLGFPAYPREVESIIDPKHQLNIALNQIFDRRRRRRRANLGRYYEPIARRVNLNRLDNVPAFQEFKNDLTNTLRNLNFIERIDSVE